MPGDANTVGGAPMWLRLVGVGLTAGFFASLFGVGGGIVMVPLLVLLLGFDTKVATATSLAAIIVTASVGVITHAGLGNVSWRYSLLIGIPAVIGLLGGLWLKERMSTRALTFAFAGLLVVTAIWLALRPASSGDHPEVTLAGGIAVAVLGATAGSLAGLFGVGGGILFVPALTLIVGLPQLLATGTSLLAIIPVSLLGSWRQHRAGTVRWRAAMTMGFASVPTAVAAAFGAEVTPPRVLQVLFALLMMFTAAQMAWRVRSAPAA